MVRRKLPKQFNKKCIAIGLFLLILYFLYCIISVNVNWEYTAEFDYSCEKNGSGPFPQVVHYCIRGPKVFFAETSGSRNLNVRQACAVESTARHNPSIPVSVFMTPTDGVDFSNELIKKLLNLPNLSIQLIDVDVFFYGTPLWQWYRLGYWKRSKWKVSHLSDALRFFIVWSYGGMYLDLDIVCLRSMEHLRNTLITQDWTSVAAGILIFDQKHEVLNETIYDFCKNYNPKNFASNGPGVISRNIQKYCDIDDFGKVSGANCNITILPPPAAFPIQWFEWEKYFKPSKVKHIADYFNSSYMIHVWNKYSKEGVIKVGENSIYETAIKEHCPIVYNYIQTQNYVTV